MSLAGMLALLSSIWMLPIEAEETWSMPTSAESERLSLTRHARRITGENTSAFSVPTPPVTGEWSPSWS